MVDELEVVWSGSLERAGECFSLVGDRETLHIGIYEPSKRVYNKKSAYWDEPRKRLVNPLEEPEINLDEPEIRKVENETVLCDSRESPDVEIDG